MKVLTLDEYNKKFKVEPKKSGVEVKSNNILQFEVAEKVDSHNTAHNLTKEAHKQALDIRKFEIDMYWKRATYFWTIIGVIFAGYFLLMKDDFVTKHPTLILLLNCIGFIFSLSWYLVNRGSKFWQNNWEKHVDLLEEGVTGPLYKTVIQNGNLKLWDLHKEYSYSVSKINQLLSLFVTFIWLAMGLYLIVNQLADFDFFHSKSLMVIKILSLTVATITTAIILVKYGKSEVGKDTNKNELLIKLREIKEE
ncbi:hypothetical protein P4K67_22065 [Bacillus cereus]|nr:hypothetical protein [Bacillus cereus]